MPLRVAPGEVYSGAPSAADALRILRQASAAISASTGVAEQVAVALRAATLLAGCASARLALNSNGALHYRYFFPQRSAPPELVALDSLTRAAADRVHSVIGMSDEAAAVPLSWQGELLGVILLTSPSGPPPGNDELFAVETLAGYLAAALANARLWSRLGQSKRRLQALQETSIAAVSSSDDDTVLHNILLAVSALFGTPQVAVLEPDETGVQLVVRASLGMPRPESNRGTRQLGMPLIEHSKLPTDIWMVRNAQNEARSAQYRPLLVPFAALALLSVPLLNGGQTVGRLVLFSQTARTWTSEEVDLLRMLAAPAASAMHRAAFTLHLTIAQAVLAAAMRGLSDAMIVTDGLGDVVLANANAERLLGLPIGFEVGQSLPDLLTRSPHKFTFRNRKGNEIAPVELFVAGQPAGGEVDVTGEDASTYEWSFLPVLGDHRQVSGGIAIFHDLTELRRLDQLKSGFISTVSHELRTPLTSIKGLVKLVLEGYLGPLNERQHESLAVADQEADRLARLINDLLDISRIEAGRAVINLVPLDAGMVINKVVQALRVQAAEREVQLRVELPPDLPLVRADGPMVHQILTNLIGNAIKFTPPGGWVVISMNPEPPLLIFHVRDTGIGIPSHLKLRVFERFFQAEPGVGRGRGGAGLGLAIAKQLVELQGGRIFVQSAPEQGSTFTFTLPVWH